MFKVILIAVLLVIAVSGRRGGGRRGRHGHGRHGKLQCDDGSAPTCTDGSAPVFDGDR